MNLIRSLYLIPHCVAVLLLVAEVILVIRNIVIESCMLNTLFIMVYQV
jgi:hypothetical protein